MRLEVEKAVRKAREGCDGAGGSGSTEGAWLEALLSCGFFFFSPSRETMTELCVGVFVLDILIHVFLKKMYLNCYD